MIRQALGIVANARARPYWDRFAETRRLHLLRCRACEQFVHYPRARCPACWSSDVVWVPVSGDGRLVSWTVARRPTAPQLVGRVPFTVGLVELDVQSGLHISAWIETAGIEKLAVGMPVAIESIETTAGPVPVFAPITQA